MPGFRNLSEKQTRAVVSYLRSLQGKLEGRNLPGDSGRGKQIFFGKGECSSCHTISGQGGFLGPDLSGYGATVSAEAIRDEIVRSRRMPAQGYRSAVLVTSEGDRLEGVIRNEDNFSIQFQNKNGGFHFFQKSELRSIDRIENSLMPTDYRERLSSAELNDLASYLMTATPDASKAAMLTGLLVSSIPARERTISNEARAGNPDLPDNGFLLVAQFFGPESEGI